MRARHVRGWFVRLAGTLGGGASDRELAEELESHLQMHVEDGVRAGLQPEEARRQALVKLGGVAATAERYREQRGLPWIEVLLQDTRHGLRRLAANPVFTTVALLSLALGIGANTAIFSLVNAMFFRPLPIERPQELVSFQNKARAGWGFLVFSYPNYKDLRDRNDVLAGLVAYRFAPLSVSHDGVSSKMWGYVVSGNYFDVLGVRASVGRMLSPDDDRLPGGHPVTVVSHRYWRQSYGADPSVVGRTLNVNGRAFTVIGVAPEGFFGTQLGIAPDFWFPAAMQAEIEMGSAWLEARDVEILMLQGRLKPGVSLAAAEAALNDVALQLEREHPDVNEGKRIGLTPPGLAGTPFRRSAISFAAILMAVVAFALLLASTNLANLLLARVQERRAEIALRLSLGASRGRLVRQLMTESMLLAGVGGLIGVLLAAGLLRLLAGVELPIDFPFLLELRLDYRVLGFTAAVAVLTGVAFGLLPALQTTSVNLYSTVKADSAVGGARRSWLKNGLIVFQVALSLVLLTGGGLMLRALHRAQTLEIGLDPRNAVELSFDLRLQGYDATGAREFRRRVLERVRSLPGVQAAGTIDLAPIDLHFGRSPVFVEGRTPERITNAPRAMASRISPGYLDAMGVRLLRGRDFSEHDDEKAPRVAIVNETFARGFWPGQDAIGKRFRQGSALSPLMEVVGVVEDGKYSSLAESAQPYVCRPVEQAYAGATSLIVRTASDPQASVAALRQEVQRLDPGMPLSARLLTDKMAVPLLPARVAAVVLGGFGLVALALAAIGIYGVMSCAVAARTREIGIRIALGADAGNVLRQTLRQGITLALVGVASGASAALGLARLMRSLLFGVSTSDPSIYVGVAALLLTAALLACYVPARRATQVDPVIALRCE
ncbi:MAG TPA: ABC transporter permease [Vicinamibacteria bacterium]|jgi:predicted permease